MSRGRVAGIKLVIYICIAYVTCFCTVYELPWLLHFGKNDLVMVEANNVEISSNRYGSRFTTYQTKIRYKHNGKSYEEEILTDARDWEKNKIIVYIEEDCPKRVYRDKYLVIPFSPASISVLVTSLLTLYLIICLLAVKKRDVKDYKIPNQ